MLDKAQRPAPSRRHATRRQAHDRKRSRTLALPAVLAIAVLVLAAPASAAGPVTGVLDTVAKVATPTVTRAVSAPAPVAPSPAAAQQAVDVAPRPAPVERTVDHVTSSPTTSSLSTAGGELTGASAHHDQSPAGAPAHQPEGAPGPGDGPHASSSTPSRVIGSGDIAGAATSTASPQRPSDPVGGVVHGVALTANQVGSTAPHPTGLLPADRGERRVLPARLLDVARAGTPAHAVRQLVLAPGLLGASHALGDVGETATRLVETTPAAIAPLLAPLARTLTLPSLPELAELPSLLTLPVPLTFPTLPGLTELSPTPPAFTPAMPASLTRPQRIALSVPAGTARGGGAGPSTATAMQGAWQASSAAQAYAATANGIRGAIGAPDRLGSTSSAAAALRGAATLAAGAAMSAYGLSASEGTALAAPGTTSPGGVYQQPSPAPAPVGASPATGAVAGTSIPIFLTLAGLLLLAAPRVRRVLRLLGESWRLSPLALIPERPG
jgi:hypothetical protein